MRRVLFAEALATALLVFGGCGLMVVDGLRGGMIGHFGINAGWGLLVAALVFAFGDLSGAHINPAVTVGFAAAGRLPWARVPGYVLAQAAGACLGALALRGLFPASPTLGQTHPQGPLAQSFGLEVAITFALMTVVLRVATGAKERGASAGLAVGFTVAVLATFAGPVSMASLNPARSLGPALVALDLRDLWLYLTAPVLGALLAVGAARGLEE